MKNRTIVIATHHVERLLDHCAWVVQLGAGRVVSQGPPEELGRKLLVAAREEEAPADVDLIDGASPPGDAEETAELANEATSKSAGNALVEKELMAKCVPIPATP